MSLLLFPKKTGKKIIINKLNLRDLHMALVFYKQLIEDKYGEDALELTYDQIDSYKPPVGAAAYEDGAWDDLCNSISIRDFAENLSSFVHGDGFSFY